jgi:hypothetical protein
MPACCTAPTGEWGRALRERAGTLGKD